MSVQQFGDGMGLRLCNGISPCFFVVVFCEVDMSAITNFC